MGRLLSIIQITALPIVLAGATLAPPARGQIAVMSLMGEAPDRVEEHLREAGAYPLGRNPDGQSLIAFGDDPALFFKLLIKGVVALRPPVACSGQ